MSKVASETRLWGVSLSPGVALGRACVYSQAVHNTEYSYDQADWQETRLSEALGWMLDRLEVLAEEAEVKLDTHTANIFRAHRLILASPSMQQRLFRAINEEQLSAESAVEQQLELYRTQLAAADSEYLRERAADIVELQRGLLDRLRGVTASLRCQDMAYCQIGQCPLGNDHILVAPELTASLAIEMDNKTRGFLVERGGKHSHATILAQALNLPAVSGIHDLPRIPLNAKILIDGNSGVVFLNPSRETLNHYHEALESAVCPLQLSDPIPELKVMANIDRAAGIHEVLTTAAEGIGLYRTEIEVLAEGHLLSEAEQTTRYTEVVKAMAGRPVYIRLLDIGADKTPHWLNLPREDNPALGCRGARLLLNHPELLREQARALARAARHGPIHVVYPMIIDRHQFLALRTLFEAALEDLPASSLRHGVMLEVPSACLQVRELLAEADFGCIGTNDLVQYLFAVDRTNEAIDSDDLLEHAVLWQLLETLAEAAQEAHRPLSLCGELAGDTAFTQRVIAAGINTVSVSPRRIAEVRQAARRQGG